MCKSKTNIIFIPSSNAATLNFRWQYRFRFRFIEILQIWILFFFFFFTLLKTGSIYLIPVCRKKRSFESLKSDLRFKYFGKPVSQEFNSSRKELMICPRCWNKVMFRNLLRKWADTKELNWHDHFSVIYITSSFGLDVLYLFIMVCQ